jgi:hypothetical protein
MSNPLDANGTPDGEETAFDVALAVAAPRLRHPVHGDERYRNGRFARGNSASLKHGQRARTTLAKKKAARFAELMADEEAQHGAVPWRVKSLVRRIAESEVHAEQASEFINKLVARGEVPTSPDVAAATAVHLAHVEKITRTIALVNAMRPLPRNTTGLAKFEIVFTDHVTGQTTVQAGPVMVVDELTPGDIERLRGERSEDINSPQVMEPESPEPSCPMVPVRVNGTVRQWNGAVGSVEIDGGAVLLIRSGDVGDLELEIGSRISVVSDGRQATAIQAAQEED